MAVEGLIPTIDTESQLRVLREMQQKEYLMDELLSRLDKKVNQLESINEKLEQTDVKKDDFISIATHELKSPIQPILGFAELAQSGMISQKEAWDGVVEMANKLQNLMGVILDANKIDRDSLNLLLSEVNIKKLVDEAVIISRSSPDCQVPILNQLPDSLVTYADRVRLGEVFQNLINNSIKFTSRGMIKITGKINEKEGIITLRFSDTGSGIPKSVLPNLFEKFVTDNPD
ncbi:MAG: HAMP domain-containing sensor histidine kinase, partial [Nitrosopumilaceae archaeon]|nr:HAMP domain-containing sensor histidine kinase [Nitrosopumilaceae archaeon]